MYTLSDVNADACAKRLYSFICDSYGKRIISGVQECPGRRHHDLETDYLYTEVGKLPAIRGLDFIHDDYDGVVRRAREWHARGGIVTICWHTGLVGNSYPASKEEYPDFERLFTPGTGENALLMSRWDRAAAALGELRSAGIPVLWRPFHEFDGQWFWWGKDGSASFRRLWRMMYEKFTNDYRLHNLVWVYGYSGEVKPGWYAGDDVCDIVGSDNYDGTTNSAAWKRLLNVTDMPLAFHEVGKLSRIDDFVSDGCLWSWFMNWHTVYLKDENTPERLREVYADPRVITLDDVKGLQI